MTRDDRIFLFHLSRNHFTRGARVSALLAYLNARVGVL
jgi:hypothetical protein